MVNTEGSCWPCRPIVNSRRMPFKAGNERLELAFFLAGEAKRIGKFCMTGYFFITPSRPSKSEGLFSRQFRWSSSSLVLANGQTNIRLKPTLFCIPPSIGLRVFVQKR